MVDAALLPLLSKPDGFLAWAQNREKPCGCGADRAKFDYVPDSVFFLVSIRLACCIHDMGYDIGGTEEDKQAADVELMQNIIKLIEAYGASRWWFPTSLARYRAVTYYTAVNLGGKKSFNYHEEAYGV